MLQGLHICAGGRFNSRSREGATGGREGNAGADRFNSRSREGATDGLDNGWLQHGVSIHAPVRERLFMRTRKKFYCVFQFTLP